MHFHKEDCDSVLFQNSAQTTVNRPAAASDSQHTDYSAATLPLEKCNDLILANFGDLNRTNSTTNNNSNCNSQSSSRPNTYRHPEDRQPASRLKILTRGDLLGAMNCAFPDMHLIREDNLSTVETDNIKEFSLFSESHQELCAIFASARKYRDEVSLDFAGRQSQLMDMVSDMIRLETEELNSHGTPSGKSEILLQKNNNTKLRPISVPNNTSPLDSDYERFTNNLLAEQYAARRFEFQNIEEIIALLDRKCSEAETTMPKTIAPFNSELPVLNISTCVVRKQQSVVPVSKVNKTGAKSKNTNKTNASSSNPQIDMSGTSIKTKDKNVSRKQSKRDRGRRANRLKLSQSYLLIDPVEEICSPKFSQNEDMSHGPISNVDDPMPAVAAVDDSPNSDYNGASSISNESIKQHPSTSNEHLSVEPTSACSVIRPVSSKDILALNIKTLKQQTILTQQQQMLADVQNREMMTFFLRQKLCGASVPYLQMQHSESVSSSAPASSKSDRTPHQTPLPQQQMKNPCLRLDNFSQAESSTELERLAMHQYRTSDESLIEAEFNRLELEAQEQYPY